MSLVVLNTAPLRRTAPFAASSRVLGVADEGGDADRVCWQAETRLHQDDERTRIKARLTDAKPRRDATGPTRVAARERLEELLERLLCDAIAVRVLSREHDQRGDPVALDAGKYHLIVAAEAAARVAQHVAAMLEWSPTPYAAEAFWRLSDDGVVPVPAAGAMVAALEVRDLLVHRHETVDEERVVAALGDVVEFERFVEHVAVWLRALH